MPLNELEIFLGALRKVESGGYTGTHAYSNPRTGQVGAYAVSIPNWQLWAWQAGVPNADWRDPAAQDFIARHKARELYERYGSWDAVAVAWFAGPEHADEYVRAGASSGVPFLTDINGKTVSEYMGDVRQAMDEAPQFVKYQAAKRAGLAHEFDGESPPEFEPPPERTAPVYRTTNIEAQLKAYIEATERAEDEVSPLRPKLTAMLNGLSNRVAGGTRSPLGRAAPTASLDPVTRDPYAEEEEPTDG